MGANDLSADLLKRARKEQVRDEMRYKFAPEEGAQFYALLEREMVALAKVGNTAERAMKEEASFDVSIAYEGWRKVRDGCMEALEAMNRFLAREGRA